MSMPEQAGKNGIGSWWAELPTFLKALGSLIGAVAVLIGALAAAGVIGGDDGDDSVESVDATTESEVVAEGQGWTFTADGIYQNQLGGYSFDVPQGWETGEGMADVAVEDLTAATTLVAPQPMIALVVTGTMSQPSSFDLDDLDPGALLGEEGLEGAEDSQKLEIDGRPAIEANLDLSSGNRGIMTIVESDAGLMVMLFLASDESVYASHVGDYIEMRESVRIEG